MVDFGHNVDFRSKLFDLVGSGVLYLGFRVCCAYYIVGLVGVWGCFFGVMVILGMMGSGLPFAC